MHEKIDRLLNNKDKLTQVELNFIVHVQNKKFFSPPEEKSIDKIYNRYFQNQWLSSYDKRKRRIMKSCAEFWVNNPPRFSELAARVLNDSEFVPTKEQYKEMCESREARNFLDPSGATPLFPPGSLVKIGYASSQLYGKLAIVIRARRDERMYPGPESKFLYHVLPQGSPEVTMFSEKVLSKVETGEK